MLRRTCALSIAFAVSTLAPTDAAATAQRTFVASNGNDANPCSLTLPCRGFAAAVTAANIDGEVIVLDSAGYGAVTITKSISLIAPAGVYAGISVSDGDGITVNAPGATVVLRGLTINGQSGASGSGVNLQQAARLRIEHCVISKMAVDGVLYSAPGAELSIFDTIVRDNGGSGIGGDADAFLVLDHVRSERNQTNGFYLASLSAHARAMITDSTFAFNGSNGIWVASTGTGVTHAQVERSVVADNGAAGINISGATNSTLFAMVTRNAIHRNGGAGVAVLGDQAFSGTTVMVADNAILGNVDGIRADGNTAFVHASANVLSTLYGNDLVQVNTATLYRYGNNTGDISGTGTITFKSGY